MRTNIWKYRLVCYRVTERASRHRTRGTVSPRSAFTYCFTVKCVAAGKCVLRNPREPWKWGKSRGGGGGGLSTFFDFNAGPLHSVPVVESKTGLACVSRSQHCLHNRYISRCNVPNRDVLYACYLLGIAGALSRRGEGGEERKERKKEERKRRGQGGKREEEGKKKKKMSRESDHAPRLGKLVDSEVPSTEGRDY